MSINSRVCDSCFDKIGSSGTSTKSTLQFDAKEDEEYERAIQESLKLSRQEDDLKRERQRRQQQDKEREMEEREIQRAIQESLKLTEQMNNITKSPSAQTFKKPTLVEAVKEPEIKIVKSKPLISAPELDSIRQFCDLLKSTESQISAQGIHSINPLQLQTLFAKVIPLHPKLNSQLSNTDNLYRRLYEFNTEIGDVVGQYDAMLRNRFMYSAGSNVDLIVGGAGGQQQFSLPSHPTYQPPQAASYQVPVNTQYQQPTPYQNNSPVPSNPQYQQPSQPLSTPPFQPSAQYPSKPQFYAPGQTPSNPQMQPSTPIIGNSQFQLPSDPHQYIIPNQPIQYSVPGQQQFQYPPGQVYQPPVVQDVR